MTDFMQRVERHWRGEADLVHAEHPVQVGFPDAHEIAPGVLYFKGMAAVAVIDTGDGLVMIDAGTKRDIDPVYKAVRAWRPDTPLRAVTFSHHHVDHVWATQRFEEEAAARGWPQPVVYAHALLPAHFDRYRKTQGWNTAINRRQFRSTRRHYEWPLDYRYPDETFEGSRTLRIGELTFELHHARGETDDHVWVWVPERRWLFPGDLFIWAVPNAGNPQKVQRYCAEWGHALRRMAECEATLMVPGHGLPIFGANRVSQALLDTADYLESIESQTVDLMNRALPLDEIIHRVQPPAHLANRPYLQPIYDHPQFLVRNIWRLYGGWWDGEPDTLLPAPRAQQAREWVALAGGTDAVLARVAALEAQGDLRMACHLVEMAMLADPGSKPAHEARARVYESRAGEQLATMTRGIFHHAADSSREGLRDRIAITTEPDAAAARAALEERIEEALVYGFAYYELARTRDDDLHHPDPVQRQSVNTPWHDRILSDHRARWITTPNNDTLYSKVWVDLTGGPVRVRVSRLADGRYWSLALMDAATNNFAMIGLRLDGPGPVDVTLVGPHEDAHGIAGRVIRAPGHDVWLLARWIVDGQADLPNAHAMQDALRVDGSGAHTPGGIVATSDPDPETFLAVVNEQLARNPPPRADADLLGRCAQVGLRPGALHAWHDLDGDVRAIWTQRMAGITDRLRRALATTLRHDSQGWIVRGPELGNFGSNHLLRAAVAMGGLAALEPVEAVYAMRSTDGQDERLSGRHAYRVRIPATGIAADSFWSLSVYESNGVGRLFFIDHPARRYSLGDRSAGLRRNADGSIDLLVCHAPPADPADHPNWLPAPTGSFIVALRAYLPRAELRQWRCPLPVIERL